MRNGGKLTTRNPQSPPSSFILTCLLVLVVLRRRPRDGAPLGGQRHFVGVLALHGGQRLLHRLLAHLGVVPLLAVGVPGQKNIFI